MMKKIVLFLLAAAIVLSLPFFSFAAEERVKSFEELEKSCDGHFLYPAINACETDSQGKESPSDMLLLPGDEVTIRVYFKTDYYSSPATSVFVWRGDFFSLETGTLTANNADDFKFRNSKLEISCYSGHCSDNAAFSGKSECDGMDYIVIAPSFNRYSSATYDTDLVGSYGEIWDSDTYFTEFKLKVKESVPLGAEATVYSPAFEWALPSQSASLPGNVFIGEEKGVLTGSMTRLYKSDVTLYDEEFNPSGQLHLEDASLTFTCAPDHTHEYESIITPPTCTEKGFTTHRCKVCGHKYTDSTVPATGHKYTEKTEKYPSCTEEGLKIFTCSCGDTYYESIPRKEHTAGGWKYTGNGIFEKKCTFCSVPLEQQTVSLESIGESITLENGSVFTVSPVLHGIEGLGLEFTSDNTAVAEVSQSGIITALSPGSCTVKATVKGSDISVSLPVSVQARKFTATWSFGSQTVTEEIYEGAPLTEPDLMDEPWIVFRYWQPSVPAKMPSHDISFSAVYANAVYSAVFVADSVTVGEREYSRGSQILNEPDVPYKKGFEGHWSDYVLTPGGITIEAVYTPATRISIHGRVPSRQVNYGSSLILSADVYEDAGGEIIWYANGRESGKGKECRFDNIGEDFTVTVSTLNAEGETVVSAEEMITVRKNIFLVIIAFFRNLLRIPEMNTQ